MADASDPAEREIVVEIEADIRELLPRFLDNRRSDVGKIREAIAGRDLKALEMIGHTMKGAGGGYGLPEVTEIGRHLEEAARQGDLDGSGRAAEALEAYLARLRIVFV